jgi:hypothetical protein
MQLEKCPKYRKHLWYAMQITKRAYNCRQFFQISTNFSSVNKTISFSKNVLILLHLIFTSPHPPKYFHHCLHISLFLFRNDSMFMLTIIDFTIFGHQASIARPVWPVTIYVLTGFVFLFSKSFLHAWSNSYMLYFINHKSLCKLNFCLKEQYQSL